MVLSTEFSVAGLNTVEGKFVTICGGRYIITVNIIVQDDVGSYEVFILYDGKQVTKARKHIAVKDGITTLNIYQILHFKKVYTLLPLIFGPLGPLGPPG